jgi:glycine dehydrogenase subunit 2
MKSFHGNFSVLVRAYAYIRLLGADGLRRVAEGAVLNANYLRSLVEHAYPVAYGEGRRSMHEFVSTGLDGIHTLDVAKRLIDYGVHPPTIYFPLIVKEALMVEPTETESVETLERFAAALLSIAEEARTDPDLLKDAPHDTPVGRWTRPPPPGNDIAIGAEQRLTTQCRKLCIPALRLVPFELPRLF